MSKKLLHKLGEQVFGAGWQSKLARHIDTNPRTVRRWASGDIPVPKVVLLYLQILKSNESKADQPGVDK